MLIPFFLLIAAARAQPPAAGAVDDAAECRAEAAQRPPPSFSVVVSTYATIVDRSLDIEGIHRLRTAPAARNIFAHGLCVADYQLRYVTKTEAACWRPGGRAAAWLDSLVVDLTPVDIRIYIAKEYPPGGCESTQLMLHEQEHETVHRRELAKLAVRMRDALANSKSLPGPQTAIDASDLPQARARLKAAVDAVVRPLYAEYLKGIEALQQDVDDPEEYRRLGASCPGWKRR